MTAEVKGDESSLVGRTDKLARLQVNHWLGIVASDAK